MGQGTHTEGPWSVHPDFPEYVVPSAHVGRPVGGHENDAEDLRRYAQEIAIGPAWDRHRSKAEVRANARLIAAAPELLKAAIRVRARCQSMRLDQDANDALDALDAAIAKAQGAL